MGKSIQTAEACHARLGNRCPVTSKMIDKAVRGRVF